MKRITQPLIDKLKSPQSDPVLSIYMPTHTSPTPPHIREDQTRFKNLIREGRDKWRDKFDDSRIDDTYQQLEGMFNDLDFWHHTSEGLAVFASVDQIEVVHLPLECEEYVFVDNYYDLTPALVVLALNQPFFVIALAMHNTKVLRGDMYGLEQIDIELPSSPEDALNIDEMFSGSNTIRSPQRSGSSGTNDTISPHGQGDSQDAGHEERLQYFRIIDNIINSSPDIDTSLPIVVAATESEAVDYCSVSQLPRLLKTHVSGNHTDTSTSTLQALAWQIVYDEIVEAKTAELLARFYELSGQDKASAGVQNIKEAAASGRVAVMLVGMIRVTADSVRDSTDSVVQTITFTDEYTNEHIAELTQAVVGQGGDICGVDIESIPEHAAVAAIYRY